MKNPVPLVMPLVFTFILNLNACGGIWTINVNDLVKEAVVSTSRRHLTLGERRLVIYNHTNLTLTINFRGEIIFLAPEQQAVVSYPYTALLADGQSLKIPIMITTDNIREKGILRTWTVHKSGDSSESWLIQTRDRETIIDIRSTGGWW